jgi:hypothetical protein
VDSSGSGKGPVTGCCEHGNEPSVSTKGGEFPDQLSEGLCPTEIKREQA